MQKKDGPTIVRAYRAPESLLPEAVDELPYEPNLCNGRYNAVQLLVIFNGDHSRFNER